MSRGFLAVLLVVGGVAATTACSDASEPSAAPSSEAAPSTEAAVCASAEDLQQSVVALQDVRVADEGVDALEAAFASVTSAAGQLADDARDQHAEQVDRLEADVTALRSAVDSARQDPTAETLQVVSAGIDDLAADAGVLVNSVGTSC
jgi:hypothetical protein